MADDPTKKLTKRERVRSLLENPPPMPVELPIHKRPPSRTAAEKKALDEFFRQITAEEEDRNA